MLHNRSGPTNLGAHLDSGMGVQRQALHQGQEKVKEKQGLGRGKIDRVQAFPCAFGMRIAPGFPPPGLQSEENGLGEAGTRRPAAFPGPTGCSWIRGPFKKRRRGLGGDPPPGLDRLRGAGGGALGAWPEPNALRGVAVRLQTNQWKRSRGGA